MKLKQVLICVKFWDSSAIYQVHLFGEIGMELKLWIVVNLPHQTENRIFCTVMFQICYLDYMDLT